MLECATDRQTDMATSYHILSIKKILNHSRIPSKNAFWTSQTLLA